MSLFSKIKVKNKVSRNGFDLSKRNCFTAQPGMLLPFYSKYVLPGDHFKMSSSTLTRTVPMKTDAFARIREYVDFFFVPFRLLYKDFPDWIIQNTKPTDSDYTGSTISFETNLPCMDIKEFYDDALYSQDITSELDEAGLYVTLGMYRLADYLGYLNKYNQSSGTTPSYLVNLWRPAAYQRIYADFYRNTLWEDNDIISWNLSPFKNGHYMIYGQDATTLSHIFRLRYANYKKDIFQSIQPSTQFGSVSIAELNSGQAFYLNNGGSSGSISATSAGNVGNSGSYTYKIYSDNSRSTPAGLSVLDLRMAEALQRWKEVTQMNGFRYNEQVEAHFGFKVPDSRTQIAEFIDGWTNTIQIDEVVNTGDNQGNISGKAVGVNDSHSIEYDVKEHGVIMAIYHIAPDVDYNQSRVDFDNSMLDYEDYFIPEYQNLGLGDLQQFNMYVADNSAYQNDLLGNQIRYAHMKSDVDECHGAFASNSGDTVLSKWIIPAPTSTSNTGQIDYRFFKVSPKCLDNLFAVESDGQPITDKFLVNFYLDNKAVRSMSVDGMPF